MSAMSRHGESLSSLWHLSPDMNLPLCRVVAEETFKCRERLPIAAPKVWPHLTISDVNKTHAEIEKYFIFLNAQNGLFNLEGLSQQWLEKQTTAFDEAVAGWFRHDLHTVWRYHAVMEEFLEEVKRLYSDPSGLHEDCEEKILKWVALLVRVFFLYFPRLVSSNQGNDPFRTRQLARTPTAILQRMASVAKLYFFTSSIDKRQADGPASLRRTNPNLKCPHASWQRSWELPNLAPLLHESPPLFYPSHNFVSTTSETFRPQGHSPAFHDVFHSTDQSLQESICLRLNEVLSDRDRAALRQEAHNALAWLRTQEVCTWYNAQLNHDKHSFVALLKWIVEEAYRIGQADGGFITLNYVVSPSFPEIAPRNAEHLSDRFNHITSI